VITLLHTVSSVVWCGAPSAIEGTTAEAVVVWYVRHVPPINSSSKHAKVVLAVVVVMELLLLVVVVVYPRECVTHAT
jgi:hypothetical protein